MSLSSCLTETAIAGEPSLSLDKTDVSDNEKNCEDFHPETGEPLPFYKEACEMMWVTDLLAKAQKVLSKTKQELAKAETSNSKPLPPSPLYD